MAVGIYQIHYLLIISHVYSNIHVVSYTARVWFDGASARSRNSFDLVLRTNAACTLIELDSNPLRLASFATRLRNQAT